jgi:hypothetical protein
MEKLVIHKKGVIFVSFKTGERKARNMVVDVGVDATLW